VGVLRAKKPGRVFWQGKFASLIVIEAIAGQITIELGHVKTQDRDPASE